MIFWNRQLMAYHPDFDPMVAQRFAQQVMILGAQFRGEIPQ
ncbi:hypothetical protein HYO99_gp20 [Roseobacter phage RD-1410W1-01]|uniref:Uncharacterized protein n=1 Tax=Roseobacter phage RD-1410W1-01 TaxID=1815984 RepID=A0A191VYG9_9CAUD|nr:hypothetical protein HYO99_gp20 [Roseobacter phage RD-1410W1-01]ANJ20754.1 hypothetical protein RDp01_gp20 [Roseobacter phage RD-1410W1-01]